jgi:hypothetical protein
MQMIPFFALPEDPHTAAFEAGRMVGTGIALLLPVAGAVWCLVRMKRPGVNHKGLASLALVFAGWGLGMLVGVIKTAKGGGTPYDIASAGVVALTALAAFPLAVGALVEPGPPKPGRGHAIAALILSGLTGFVLMASFGMGILKGMEQSRLAKSGNGEHSEALRFEAEGFVLKNLPIPWVRTEAKKLNSVASFATVRTRPGGYFMVISEKTQPGKPIAVENLVAIVKSNLLNASADAKVLSEGPENLNGADGIRLVCRARVNNLDLVYRYWIYSGNDHAYQAIGWIQGQDGGEVVRVLDPVFSNFELLPHP